MKSIITFIKGESILVIAWIAAIISAFFVHPSKEYIRYIDWRSLGILWSLMIIMQGLKNNGFFEKIGLWLLNKTKKVWQLDAVLVFLCFFSSMFITNDVSLITFVPFAVIMLRKCNKEKMIMPIVILQTIAANLGSMLTPIGNPQNLYIYGNYNMNIIDFVTVMLPYTIVSMLLLVVSLCFINGKKEEIISYSYKDNNNEINSIKINKIKNSIVYIVLFIIAILTVVRIVPFYVTVAVVLVVVSFVEKKVIRQIDYGLLLTFVGFFIFTGNMACVHIVKNTLQSVINGKEVIIGVLVSQCISNVPATLLLSSFTKKYKLLLIGVNVGGLGTLIASMASLISYKIFANEYKDKKGKYLIYFTITNLMYLAILLIIALS